MISREEGLILKEMGDLLRFLRTKKNLSQEQVAFEVGISRSQYQSLERGVANFGILTLYRLAEVLEVDPAVFIISNKTT